MTVSSPHLPSHWQELEEELINLCALPSGKTLFSQTSLYYPEFQVRLVFM